MKSTIRLFKSVIIAKKKRKKYIPSSKELKKTVPHGFIFSPEIYSNHSEQEMDAIAKIVVKELGLTSKQMNNAFHKSWKKIKESSMEQLVFEQMVHYMTTYGFEMFGAFSNDSVYVPGEKLRVPKIKGINLIVIKGYTKKEMKEKLLSLLQSEIALGPETVMDAVDIAVGLDFSANDVESIRNKEARIALCDALNVVPENPTEFLRYVIYRLTGKTLLIKDRATIELLKEHRNSITLALFKNYKRNNGLKNLSTVFYRHKPIFLALKNDNGMNTVINKIRKLAAENHKPMPEDYLNAVTSRASNGSIDERKLKEKLKKANTFRKIRLAYSLNYRNTQPKSILYQVRNGKGFAKGFDSTYPPSALDHYLGIVKESIIEDIKSIVKNKKIRIPEFVDYPLPATEKQFVGYLPLGTCITVPSDMVFGIHWLDVRDNRIDLDLALLNASGKYGWDGNCRSDNGDILFSGDMTNAPEPDGAAELFHINRKHSGTYVAYVNYYNYDKSVEVPFDIIVAQKDKKTLNYNHVIDPNKTLGRTKSLISKKQQTIGMVISTEAESRFYFLQSAVGKSVTSGKSEYSDHVFNYMRDYFTNMISLKDIFVEAGAKIIIGQEKHDIDLSPESLEKDTITNLIKN